MNEKRVALITGGARGIGFGASTKFAERGYDLAIVGSSAEERYAEAIGMLRALGAKVRYIRQDISKIGELASIVEATDAEYGRIDVLVNNSGVAPKQKADVLETTPESFDRVLGINLRGTYFMTQTVANYMIREVQAHPEIRPRIVTVSSVSSRAASVNRGEYCISKAGISMITSLFAARLAPYGITVNEIRPGLILTDMSTPESRIRYAKIFEETDLVPLKRWGRPEECGAALAALCADDMSYVTGACLYVDGGMSIPRL